MRKAFPWIMLCAITLIGIGGVALAAPPTTSTTTTTVPPPPASPTRGVINCGDAPNFGAFTGWIAMGRNTHHILNAEPVPDPGTTPAVQMEASIDGVNPVPRTLIGTGTVNYWDANPVRWHHAWPFVRFRCYDQDPSQVGRVVWAIEEGAV